jgi:hypothetical protein
MTKRGRRRVSARARGASRPKGLRNGREDPCELPEDPFAGHDDPFAEHGEPFHGHDDPRERPEDVFVRHDDPCRLPEDPRRGHDDPCRLHEDLVLGHEEPSSPPEDPRAGRSLRAGRRSLRARGDPFPAEEHEDASHRSRSRWQPGSEGRRRGRLPCPVQRHCVADGSVATVCDSKRGK